MKGIWLPWSATLLLAACSGQGSNPDTGDVHAAAEPARGTVTPIAIGSLQELMAGLVDPAADGVWNAVAWIDSAGTEQHRQPANEQQWLAVRRQALLLAEATNLLLVSGRPASATYSAAESRGALDSRAIDTRVREQWPRFQQLALGLRLSARQALRAIDARDAAQLEAAGGLLEQSCESCHSTFWYPDEVVPQLPPPGQMHAP
ncbi:MAG: cytochrome c [Steroidobacteraceae bacterium]